MVDEAKRSRDFPEGNPVRLLTLLPRYFRGMSNDPSCIRYLGQVLCDGVARNFVEIRYNITLEQEAPPEEDNTEQYEISFNRDQVPRTEPTNSIASKWVARWDHRIALQVS